MLSREPSERHSDAIRAEGAASMSKWAIVFNHDDLEFSVYSEKREKRPLDSESNAWTAMEQFEKKARVDLIICLKSPRRASHPN
jgi:hypothetical protein